MTAPDHDSKDRLCVLLALLPWQRAADGLFPPDALRQLMLGVDATSTPEPGTPRDERWIFVTNVAHEFGRLLTDDAAPVPPRATVHLAMHVLRAFEPPDPHVARTIGGLLPANTAGRRWVEDVVATAWQVVSDHFGRQRMKELQHDLRGA